MDDRILNKIKKCLALSNSPEPHEAAAALRQAQKLMEAYGVSQTDLSWSEIGEAEIKSKASVSRIKNWELRLVNLVAKAFGCNLLWLRSNSHATDVYGRYVFIGLKPQVVMAQYTCEVLQRKLIAGRTRFVSTLPATMSRKNKTIEADGFCQGWTDGIAKTVHDFGMSSEQSARIEEYARSRALGKAKIKDSVCGRYGMEAGRAASANESLNRPITERDQTYLN